MAGVEVLIWADLLGTSEGGLKRPIETGHCSVVYMFPDLENVAERQGFGAAVEEVVDGGAPGGQLRARINFWADLAEVYATPGARFDLWLGRVVGHGEVLEVAKP